MKTRAKFISTINYVDKGQNKGLFTIYEKPWFSMVNDVGSAYTISLFSYETMLH